MTVVSQCVSRRTERTWGCSGDIAEQQSRVGPSQALVAPVHQEDQVFEECEASSVLAALRESLAKWHCQSLTETPKLVSTFSYYTSKYTLMFFDTRRVIYSETFTR